MLTEEVENALLNAAKENVMLAKFGTNKLNKQYLTSKKGVIAVQAAALEIFSSFFPEGTKFTADGSDIYLTLPDGSTTEKFDLIPF